MRFLIFSLFLLGTAACSSPTAAPATVPSATEAQETTAATYAGDWDVTVEDTPAGTVSGTLTLMDGAERMTGKFTSGGSETELSAVERTDSGLSITFYSSQYQTDVTMNLRGLPSENTLTGTTLGSYPTEAVRKN